jgi:hypothetical protein
MLQTGGDGRPWPHLHRPYLVEGLVDCMVRGGSSPLGRILKPLLGGPFVSLDATPRSAPRVKAG